MQAVNPRFTDWRQGVLETLARGRLAAAMSRLGPDRGFAVRWRPTVAGERVRNGDDPEEGFATKPEAVAAARRYRDSCREALAETNGSV